MCRENCKAIKYLAFIIVLLASCKKDKPGPTENAPPTNPATQNVYIICEGSFGNGNSWLSLYRPEVDSVYNNVYGIANDEDLGDVFQSMTLIGENYFLCVNNSDKIVVINRDNWMRVGTIPVQKPRYIQEVSATKAYVTSLYSNKITIINPQTMQVTGTINMPGNNPEGILKMNNTVYVALWDTAVNQLYQINTTDDHVTPVQYLEGRAPKEIVADKQGMLWVLAGNIQQGKKASLTRIDAVNFQPMGGFVFPPNADPLRLNINAAGNKLYFLGVNYSGGEAFNGVYTMRITDTALPAQPIIQAQPLQYFWALGIDPYTEDIYVGDPKGFTQKGTVYIYNSEGEVKKNFNCGVGPGHFLFE
jgi:YVTN family beta-propeller protein